MTEIDWSKPIEAVHKDGRVVPMKLRYTTASLTGPTRFTEEAPDSCTSNDAWSEDGSDWCHLKQWHIRNVQPATPSPNLKLYQEMVELVKRMASAQVLVWKDCVTAQALAKRLKFEDADLIEARKVVINVCEDGDWSGIWKGEVEDGKQDDNDLVMCALAGIKRGKALASQEGQA
jgi:hypothetical protein